ncbi:hypothetical protein KAR91_17825 [Candidatus Pacearchaeota archaeon]|nr:hypothetical protein [Candidatus Pacearchaeota archaeon]
MTSKSDIQTYMDFARNYPVEYSKKVLNLDLWSKQQQILAAIADPDITQISVRSGNAVGKTFLTGAIICQYLDTHYPGYAIVSGASHKSILKTIWPTLRQIKDNAKVDLGGHLMTTEWRRGAMWGAFVVSPDAPENFGGYRTKNGALVIIDEASSLDHKTMDAIKGVCSANGSKIVLLGNPLRPEGPFYDSFSSGEWTNFHISSREVAELDIPGLATLKWCDQMLNEYGADSPVYHARVLGQFPSSTSNSLVKLEWLPSIIVPRVLKRKGQLRMGVDVARFGDDRSVIVIRDDHCIRNVEIFEKKRTTTLAGEVIRIAQEHNVKWDQIRIDDTGVGGGVTDTLIENNWWVEAVNFGSGACNKEKFLNKRAELYWEARESFNPQSDNPVYVPKQFEALIKEMTWPRYEMTGTSQIKLEPKDHIKKRKGRSPDLADAAVLTFPPSEYDFSSSGL